jgi:hypothetical protein
VLSILIANLRLTFMEITLPPESDLAQNLQENIQDLNSWLQQVIHKLKLIGFQHFLRQDDPKAAKGFGDQKEERDAASKANNAEPKERNPSSGVAPSKGSGFDKGSSTVISNTPK